MLSASGDARAPSLGLIGWAKIYVTDKCDKRLQDSEYIINFSFILDYFTRFFLAFNYSMANFGTSRPYSFLLK